MRPRWSLAVRGEGRLNSPRPMTGRFGQQQARRSALAVDALVVVAAHRSAVTRRGARNRGEAHIRVVGQCVRGEDRLDSSRPMAGLLGEQQTRLRARRRCPPIGGVGAHSGAVSGRSAGDRSERTLRSESCVRGEDCLDSPPQRPAFSVSNSPSRCPNSSVYEPTAVQFPREATGKIETMRRPDSRRLPHSRAALPRSPANAASRAPLSKRTPPTRLRRAAGRHRRTRRPPRASSQFPAPGRTYTRRAKLAT